AAGVILYELLTGEVPFSGKSPIHVMTAHLTEDPKPPSDRTGPGKITPALDAAVLHALAKKPDERYSSSTAFATALASALMRPRDVASTAPPPMDDEIGTRDTELSLDVPSKPARRQAARSRSGRLWLVVALVAALIGIAAGVVLSLNGRS